MPLLLCNRVLDSPFPPKFFASFSLATTYFEPNLVGVSNSGSLWHYSIHPLRSFCQPFSVNSLKTSTIIHPSASHNFQYVCNHLPLLLIPGIIFCNLHIGIPPPPPSVDPPSCECCSFAITLHGVRRRMEHLKPPEPLLLDAATNKAEAWTRKCRGTFTKLRADSTRKRKRFKLPRCLC